PNGPTPSQRRREVSVRVADVIPAASILLARQADSSELFLVQRAENLRFLGVIDYIRKPFAMERLLETVNKALGIAKPTDESKKPE
ncbi:MAG TPA: hypothetical protein VG122_06165, partial [Gemmata sp.]|nr:hypothetical protein [Gemmata sp.]